MKSHGEVDVRRGGGSERCCTCRMAEFNSVLENSKPSFNGWKSDE